MNCSGRMWRNETDKSYFTLSMTAFFNHCCLWIVPGADSSRKICMQRKDLSIQYTESKNAVLKLGTGWRNRFFTAAGALSPALTGMLHTCFMESP